MNTRQILGKDKLKTRVRHRLDIFWLETLSRQKLGDLQPTPAPAQQSIYTPGMHPLMFFKWRLTIPIGRPESSGPPQVAMNSSCPSNLLDLYPGGFSTHSTSRTIRTEGLWRKLKLRVVRTWDILRSRCSENSTLTGRQRPRRLWASLQKCEGIKPINSFQVHGILLTSCIGG